MSKFTAVELTGHRYVVTGADVFGNTGKTVIDGTEWAGIVRHDKAHKAEAEFDQAVNEFFAPMVEAQAKFDAVFSGEDEEDAIESIVLHERVEATPGQEEMKVRLSKDSQILRLIESNEFDRLMWVGEDTLEILKSAASAAAVVAAQDDEDQLAFEPMSDEDAASVQAE